MTVLRPPVSCSEAAVLSAVESPGLVLGVTTPLVTMSSELTNPGGSSLEGADEEDGLVLDPAILVLGDEDLNEMMSQKPAIPHDPPEVEAVPRRLKSSAEVAVTGGAEGPGLAPGVTAPPVTLSSKPTTPEGSAWREQRGEWPRP